MKKIPTLFVRDKVNRALVTSEVNPEAQWVIDGEGVATRKYDGTCVMYDGDQWWARREVKPGKATPDGYVPVSTDEVTGKVVGWEPAPQSPFWKFMLEAGNAEADPIQPGTYELCGPKVNGNPEGLNIHHLISHAQAVEVAAPRTYDGLAVFMADFPHEGVVWHHLDGRMAKLKRRDFGGPS